MRVRGEEENGRKGRYDKRSHKRRRSLPLPSKSKQSHSLASVSSSGEEDENSPPAKRLSNLNIKRAAEKHKQQQQQWFKANGACNLEQRKLPAFERQDLCYWFHIGDQFRRKINGSLAESRDESDEQLEEEDDDIRGSHSHSHSYNLNSSSSSSAPFPGGGSAANIQMVKSSSRERMRKRATTGSEFLVEAELHLFKLLPQLSANNVDDSGNDASSDHLEAQSQPASHRPPKPESSSSLMVSGGGGGGDDNDGKREEGEEGRAKSNFILGGKPSKSTRQVSCFSSSYFATTSLCAPSKEDK